MGKGDRRSKRGKIWRGSFGNCRPKPKHQAAGKKKPANPAKKTAPAPAPAVEPAAPAAK